MYYDKDKRESKNAIIESTALGVQHTEHGILSFSIRLNYGGSSQGFGGIILDTVNPAYGDPRIDAPFSPDIPRRIETPLGSSLLLAIDRVFAKDWEQLIGTPCRAYSSDSNIIAIGHYLEDRWLWYDKTKNEFRVTPLESVG